MAIIKGLHHSTSICESSKNDADMHQLVTCPKEIKGPRKPPFWELH